MTDAGPAADSPAAGGAAAPVGRKVAFVAVVYFAQGTVPGVSLTALTDYLTANGAPLEQTGTLAAWIGVPWVLAFLWGPLIDNVRVPGTPRRLGWILVPAAGGAAALHPAQGAAANAPHR